MLGVRQEAWTEVECGTTSMVTSATTDAVPATPTEATAPATPTSSRTTTPTATAEVSQRQLGRRLESHHSAPGAFDGLGDDHGFWGFPPSNPANI